MITIITILLYPDKAQPDNFINLNEILHGHGNKLGVLV